MMYKPLRVFMSAAVVLAAWLFIATQASAVAILCSSDTTKNHMSIDDSQVSACLDSGTGNLTGNPANDLFLNGVGSGYEFAGKQEPGTTFNPFNILYTQSGDMGTWNFDASFWSMYSDGAIAFKFGTGNQPDEWFVYQLNAGITSGDWEFINVFGRGGGLSHVNLYGMKGKVAEPATVTLLALGLLLLGATRRRKALAPA
ncbi:MAG: hypothetical protein MI794_19115 [Pseudomonadales bacterium]|nr:hypothetical protein [Pseudomonadales bacterium]